MFAGRVGMRFGWFHKVQSRIAPPILGAVDRLFERVCQHRGTLNVTRCNRESKVAAAATWKVPIGHKSSCIAPRVPLLTIARLPGIPAARGRDWKKP
jgi:hypothetical protein